jgi:hypothetical protein
VQYPPGDHRFVGGPNKVGPDGPQQSTPAHRRGQLSGDFAQLGAPRLGLRLQPVEFGIHVGGAVGLVTHPCKAIAEALLPAANLVATMNQRIATPDRSIRLLVIGLALMLGSWILLTPPGGGPDEPAHLIRSAGLIRGQHRGAAIPNSLEGRLFDVPAWVASIDPSCYAQDRNAPASCAVPTVQTDDTVPAVSTAYGYPVWAHVLPGLGTLAGGAVSGTTLARVLSALLPAILIGWSLTCARRRSPLMTAGCLMSMTPMAWSTMSQVNPSALAIAGGIALFTGLLSATDEQRPGWLGTLGFASLILPRRDGAFWAFAGLGIVVVLRDWTLRGLWQMLSRGQQAVCAVSFAAMALWALTTPGHLSKLLLVSPALTAGVVCARWLYRRPGVHPLAATSAIAVGVAGTAVVFASARPQPVDPTIVRLIVSSTGERLQQAIGVLSWLDAPVPDTSVFLFLIGLGMLGAGALMASTRTALAATAAITLAIVMSWVMELAQGDSTGTYWQGRYYLPLLVLAPLLLGSVSVDPSTAGGLARVPAIISLVVANTGMFEAARRWGVGIYASMNPTDFDTYGAVLPPVLLLFIHLAGTSLLWLALFGRRPDRGEHSAVGTLAAT